ncbi:hypothetical protein HanRHA438_Chr09g0416661 [Helianthus annuus]|nr:hypothetical protein HanHA300_Chr09g0332171 [Helianthus annuus]KAJ0543671.1 hypothetical protein HanHA89_Chr09g0353161 [Helianthus annuus]KAJ0708726.1 hypothetical protein HanLR1_Chr09g0332481 [Helianthus annuus]KAJ0712640.1 hypothetical protein HanOQP8_Chr09g0337001 [Helianthus annuus]KAJ0889792.1 hypothetical protein HanRHA438_Chr09g0416661 [Helianthus annuus]
MNNSQSEAEQATAQAKAEALAGQQIKEKAQVATKAVKNATGMNN